MRMLTALTITGFLLAAVVSVKGDEGETSLGRLPTNLSPSHYVVELQPDTYTGNPPFYFNGSVSIRFVCEVATSVVYLNSKGLNIDGNSISIVVAPDSNVTAPQPVLVKHHVDSTVQFLKIFVDADLTIGAEYLVGVVFNGTMKEVTDQDGLFWSSYVGILDGETHYVASTHLEAHGARQVFPCFDEPKFKATFDITVLRSPGVISLSNGKLLRSENRGNGWIADVFNTTLKMSTYLVCIAVGDFDYLESFTSSGTRVRIYGRPEYMQDLGFAHQIAAIFQDWYENWTGMINPTEKVDHVAVPGRSGAMENWGLIAYSEDALMYNSSIDDLYAGRSVAAYIGHELAHFWFGDLVTMSWWDDIWLNEGFASYFESLPFGDVLGLDPDTQAVNEWLRDAMDVDSEVTSTPLVPDVVHPWEADTKAFDRLIYSKGSAIVRMIHQVLGDKTFQRGIRQYLTDNAFGNVDTDTLWDALTKQAEIDGITDTDGTKLYVKEKMDSWVHQRGYPLVNITLTGPGKARAEQTQFLNPHDQVPPPSPFLYEWYIPLTMTDEETQDWDTTTKHWLNREDKDIAGGLPNSTDHWYVVNIDQLGFYRVRYDTDSYMRLIDQLVANASVIRPIVRYSIHNDAVHLARAGLELETYAMEVSKFLDQEDNLAVWDSAERGLRYPSLILDRYNRTSDLFGKYLRTKLDPAYSRFGWDNDNDDVMKQEARAIALGMACSYGNPDCQQEARKRFDDLKTNPQVNRIPPDQRSAVYCSAIATGDEDDWDFLHSQYLAINTSPQRSAPNEIRRILPALACTLNDSIIWKYLNYTFDQDKILSIHAAKAIKSISKSSRGRWIMWEHLQNNWNNTPTPQGARKLDALKAVVKGFGTEHDVMELESFIETYPPLDDAERAAYQAALNMARTNKRWADVNEPAMNTWLTENIGPASSRHLNTASGLSFPINGALKYSVSSSSKDRTARTQV